PAAPVTGWPIAPAARYTAGTNPRTAMNTQLPFRMAAVNAVAPKPIPAVVLLFGRRTPATTDDPVVVASLYTPNKSTTAGIGLGATAFTAAILNGNWVFIAVLGFVPAVYLAAGAIGQPVTG